jgi:hypothetical protein
MFLLSLDLFQFLERTLDAGIKEAFVLARVCFHASKQNGTLDERANCICSSSWKVFGAKLMRWC